MAKKTVKPKEKRDVQALRELSKDERVAALSTTLAEIEKNHGKGAIMRLGDRPKMDVPVVSTGVLSIDVCLGIGGVPKGRIVEIYGPEASGKTTIALQIVAQAQAAGGIAAYIDAEHALDPVYAEKLGVNIDELYISQPDDGEQALEICETMVRSAVIDVVVVDSVAALVPRAEIAGEMGQVTVGAHARLMSQALRKLTAFVANNRCVLIFINQIRSMIQSQGRGPSETTTGGRALKFYSSIRIDVRRIGAVEGTGDEIVGAITKIKIAKNKLAPPFKQCTLKIIYGEGISALANILDIAIEAGIVTKSGSWISYEGTRVQGYEKFLREMRGAPRAVREIENKVRELYTMPPLPELTEEEVAAALEKHSKNAAQEKIKAKAPKLSSAAVAAEDDDDDNAYPDDEITPGGSPQAKPRDAEPEEPDDGELDPDEEMEIEAAIFASMSKTETESEEPAKKPARKTSARKTAAK
ncbi:MAG: recombinase RecA [Clostridiales bacterium]|jgi:recombination protein RecA|nr:recombinase RecA [Clostridiales bacterium]